MTGLDTVIAEHDLDPEGVELYLAEARFASRLGRTIDPTALRLCRKEWPSRFSADYPREVYRVRTALAPFAEGE